MNGILKSHEYIFQSYLVSENAKHDEISASLSSLYFYSIFYETDQTEKTLFWLKGAICFEIKNTYYFLKIYWKFGFLHSQE